ncbi:MAG: cytochrome c [Ferruginibacter sp.]
MKKIAIISAIILVSATLFIGCGNKREPGRVYMPDMGVSRAYETYAERDSLRFTADPNNKGGLIFYNNRPVNGTMKRGELPPYALPNDSNGYKMSAAIKNPYDSVSAAELAEAGRLYNINCGICHGEKAGGNGPVAEKIGAVANLASGEKALLSDGTMFHVMQYGKNYMGSYASQLDAKQRWMIIKYIRTLQAKPATGAAATSDSTGATAKLKSDSTVKQKM